MVQDRGSVLDDVVLGALGGLVAAAAMNRFQAALAKLDAVGGGSGDDPSTVKAAEHLVGHPIAPPAKPGAGNRVHYGFGAWLGAIYGVATRLWPPAAAGGGLPFGIAVMALADEIAVPALKLSAPPWTSPAATHAYSLASHLVFGAALDATRRLLRLAQPR